MAEYISRRKFIGLGAGAAVGAGMLRLDPAWGEAPAIGNPLVEPELLESRRGRLRATLVLEKQRMVVAGREVEATVYNGSLPAPTLVAEPGDRIDLRLVNRLDEHTNIHTHGFHVRPDGNADNVFLHIAPGETFDYRFDIPRNHAPGLNWYHPHVHGHGTQQIFGGAAGAIVIRGEHDARQRRAGRRAGLLRHLSGRPERQHHVPHPLHGLHRHVVLPLPSRPALGHRHDGRVRGRAAAARAVGARRGWLRPALRDRLGAGPEQAGGRRRRPRRDEPDIRPL